jgi:hypothetical protein
MPDVAQGYAPEARCSSHSANIADSRPLMPECLHPTSWVVEEQDPGVLRLPSQARDRRHREQERPSSLGPPIVAVEVTSQRRQVSGGNIHSHPASLQGVPEVTNALI